MDNNREVYLEKAAAVKAAGVETYGYGLEEVMAALSEVMQARLTKALNDLANPKSRCLVAACFNVYMQMKAVSSSGKLALNDRAVIDTQALMMAESGKAVAQ